MSKGIRFLIGELITLIVWLFMPSGDSIIADYLLKADYLNPNFIETSIIVLVIAHIINAFATFAEDIINNFL